eukprot:366226-Chlamydomonas_euryale.AAC.14
MCTPGCSDIGADAGSCPTGACEGSVGGDDPLRGSSAFCGNGDDGEAAGLAAATAPPPAITDIALQFVLMRVRCTVLGAAAGLPVTCKEGLMSLLPEVVANAALPLVELCISATAGFVC